MVCRVGLEPTYPEASTADLVGTGTTIQRRYLHIKNFVITNKQLGKLIEYLIAKSRRRGYCNRQEILSARYNLRDLLLWAHQCYGPRHFTLWR